MMNNLAVEILVGETLPDVLRDAANWIEANSADNIWHIITEQPDHNRQYAIFIYYCP